MTVTAPAPPEPTEFADALREAVAASGLCLESIQRRLAARQVEVSVSTLSYWQNGVRSPGRRRSQEVVAHLESVLGLRPRSLRVLIPPPRPRGRRSEPMLPEMPREFAEREAVRRVAEKVQDCRGQLLTRLSQHDVLEIDADRRVSSLRSQLVVRADLPDIDSIGFTHFFEDPAAGTPHLEVFSGGRVSARHRDPAHRVASTEIGFGRVLQRGETVLLDVEVTSTGRGPADRSYDASVGVGVRELTVQVRFRSGDLPAWCESHQRLEESGEEVRRRVPVGVQGHAHTVVLEFPSGTVGLAWDWA